MYASCLSVIKNEMYSDSVCTVMPIIGQSHLIDIAHLIYWWLKVLWNNYFFSKITSQNPKFLMTATLSKLLHLQKVTFHKTFCQSN